ncbi:MAG: response regulator transcription factor [Verrucomicrobiota bacterium]
MITNRVLLVDDHPITREGMRFLLETEGDIEVVEVAGSVQEALDKTARARPNVVISDLSMKGRNGLELIKDLKVLHPDVKVIIVSMHDEMLYGERVLRAGGWGYIMKEDAADHLIGAIRKVSEGKNYLSPELSDHLLKRLGPGSDGIGGSESMLMQLTDREMEVFELTGQGKEVHQIAKSLQISGRTVEAHRTNARKKLGLPDANAFFRYAVRWVESGNLVP